MKNRENSFQELVNIMDRLRDKNGCPWDMEQTRDSIKPYLVEETYEALEAIEENNPEKIKEELGDLLFQIIFHAKIAKEKNEFDIHDVCRSVKEKMINRHPHVFGASKASTSKEVLRQWEDIKRKEPKNADRKSALDGVPANLPSLLKARRIQEKAARMGFDWENIDQVFSKVEEEIDELKKSILANDYKEIEHELGDAFFALVNIGRFKKINPDDAMRKVVNRFIERFKYIETQTAKNGKDLKDISLQEMDCHWNDAKRLERNK